MAGQNSQGSGSIAIGYLAGQNNEGTNSIAIGNLAGPTGMQNNSIALNASGVPLYATGSTGGFYINPIADYTNSLISSFTGYFKLMMYGNDNQVVSIDPNALPYSISNVSINLENSTFSLTFNYPYQFLGGPFYLPFITTLNITITATSQNINLQTPLIIKDQSQSCIKTPSNLNVTTTIYVFNKFNKYSNFNATEGTVSYGSNNGIYYIYIPPSICNLSSFELTVWYSNGNGDGEKTTIPSINLTQQIHPPVSPNLNINGILLSYLPQISNILSNQIITYTLDDTFQNFSNTDIRFNKSNNPITQNNNSFILRKTEYDIFNELFLTPESSYNITVNAIGSIQGVSSTVTTSATLSTITPIFTPNFYLDIMKINGSNHSGTTIYVPVFDSNNSRVKQATSFQNNKIVYIEESPNSISFSTHNIYLQNNITKRGTLSGETPLISIELICNRTNGLKLIFNNISILATSPVTLTEISSPITFSNNTVVTPSLTYTITESQSLPNLQGFYKFISFNFTLPDDTITATLSVNYLNNNYDPTTFNKIVFNYGMDSLLEYIYDGPYSNPTLDSTISNIVFNSSTVLKKICGISVVSSPLNNLTFDATLKNISNIGNYYYNSNQIILYSFTTTPSSNLITFTNTSLKSINESLTNTLYFTIDNNGNYSINQGIEILNIFTTSISANFYFQQITINVVLYNPIGNSTSYSFVIPVIYDTISTQTHRVSSLDAGTELNRPCNYPVTCGVFDNTEDLTLNHELLYTNGIYVTPGLNNPELYYIDYSQKYNGTNSPNPNYTSIVNNSYRYTTFSYNVTDKVTNSISHINIIINNTSQMINSDETNIIYINNTKLLLFYRIEIVSATTGYPLQTTVGPLDPTGSIPDNNGSTNWIDCNNNSSTGLTSIYEADGDGLTFLYSSPSFIFDSTSNIVNTISDTTANIQRNIPYQMNNIPTPTYNVIVYVRIGVPMNKPFSFTDISVQLSI